MNTAPISFRFSKSGAQSLGTISLFFLVPIDNLNALLREAIGLSPLFAQVSKMLILGLCIAGMERSRRMISLSILSIAFGWALLHGFISPMATTGWFLQDFGFCIKWVQFIIIFLFIDEAAFRYRKRLENVLIFSFILLAGNLLLSLFGIGGSQYGDGVGALGFFISGNEVSAMQLILTSAALALSFRKSLALFAVIALLSVLLGALKGTKTGIFGVLLVCLLTPIAMGSAIRGRISIIQSTLFVGGFAVIAPILFHFVSFIIQKLGVFQRFMFFVSRNGLVGAIFSDRQNRLLPFFTEYTDQWSIPAKLFGIGLPDGNLYGYIELDLLDLLFSEGLIGLLLIATLWLGMVFYLLKFAIGGSRMASQALMLLLMLLLISNLSGHVIYSGLAMPFLGIYLGITRSEVASKY